MSDDTPASIVVKPDENGTISLAIHKEELEKQRDFYEKRFNEMQQCLTVENGRLRDLLADQVKTAGGSFAGDSSNAKKDDDIISTLMEETQQGNGAAVVVRKPPAKTSPPAKIAIAKKTPATKKSPAAKTKKAKTTRKPYKKKPPKPAKPNMHKIRWAQRYQELIEFQQTRGHLTVIRTPETAKLCVWIAAQRYEHRLLTEGKTSLMTPDRIQMLNKVPDWRWAKLPKYVKWNTRYQQLLNYRDEYGHMNVPEFCTASPAGLGTFVLEQRRICAGDRTGVDRKLTNEQLTERVEKLRAIGFV